MIRPRIRRLFRLAIRRPHRVAAEMDDEIRFHIDMRVEQLVSRGWTQDAARTEALRLFGSFPEMRRSLHAAARRREEILTMGEKLDALRHDVGYALRQIGRSPGLAVAVVMTFALGIGANATMFGIIDRLLLRPPAHVRAAEELQRPEVHVKFGDTEFTNRFHSYPVYVDFRDRVPGFSSVGMYTSTSTMSLGLGADARKVDGMLVSGTYFGTLGARPLLGRPILPGDDVLPNGSPVAVIGYGLWQREFGGSPTVIGKPITLASRQFTIIGVAPPGFAGVESQPVDLWIPISAAEGMRFAGKDWATTRNSQWLAVIGRVKPGVSTAVLAQQITAAYRAGEPKGALADSSRGQVVSVLPSRQRELSPERRVAALLGGVSLLVLLIACANVANLLLVRAFSRRREIAVRLALGISRARLVRQLVTEAMVLALAGGLAALAVVRWGSVLVQSVLLSGFAWPDSPIDGRVLAFTAAATIVVGLITGLVPAWQGSDPHLARTLKEGSRGAGQSRSRTRAGLLLVQAAVSVILLIGTGLFVRSLRHVNALPFGLDVDRLVNATIDLRSVGIDAAAAEDYFERARDAVSHLPGVAGATLADAPPFGGWSNSSSLEVPGFDSLPKSKQLPNESWVAPNYFATVGMRLLRGRSFTEADTRAGAAPVIIISESVARWLWPNQQAIGKCIRVGDEKDPCSEIIAIAQTAHSSRLAEPDERMQIYLPLKRGSTDVRARGLVSDVRARVLILRPTGDDPAALIEPVRRVMQTLIPGLPFANVRPMRQTLVDGMRPWRLGATMFAAFGLIALVLASLGLYSVVAYTVAQRMHEMGVRVALGAQVGDIRRLVLTQGLRIAAAGVAIGTIIALATGKLIAPMLFQTSPRDPAVFGAVIAVLLGVATVASLVPARRAVRADPLMALRAE